MVKVANFLGVGRKLRIFLCLQSSLRPNVQIFLGRSKIANFHELIFSSKDCNMVQFANFYGVGVHNYL